MGMRHKKWMNTIAGSAVLVMALVGCGDQSTPTPPSGPEQGSGTSVPSAPNEGDDPADAPATSAPGGGDSGEIGGPGQDAPNVGKPPPGAKPLAAKQIDGSGLPTGHPKKVLVKGSTLSITAQESGCDKATAELDKQTGSQVQVTLVVTQPKEPKMCTMDIRFPSLNVELDEPIGKRTVVLKAEKRKG